MKILFIDFRLPYLLHDDCFPAGGYSVELNNWLTGLSQIGCHCGVLVWKGARNLINKELSFELIDTYNPKKGIKVIKYFYSYLPALYRSTRQFKPDIIVQGVPGVHTGMMSVVAQLLNIPFIYRVASDTNVDNRYKQRMHWSAHLPYSYGLSKSTAILCQNHYQCNQLKKKYPSKHIEIILNPYTPFEGDFLSPFSRIDKKYIAWIGNFRYDKNLQLLFDIASSLPSYSFRVAGMPVKNIDLETTTALNQLEKLNNVQFTGYIERNDIGNFLSEAIMLLNTSHWEGLSNTFLEAFDTGTPVVCPDRVDPDGIIAKNRLGFVTEDDDSLKSMVEKLYLLNSQEYLGMSNRGREYLKENHDAEVLANKLKHIFNHVLSQYND